MKKRLLSTILPLIVLASCSLPNSSTIENILAGREKVTRFGYAVSREGDSERVTYLMMSKYGYIENSSGKTLPVTVESKFFENCIIYHGDVGSALPNKSEVKSSVAGATFRGWAVYKDDVNPEYVETVQADPYNVLYAIYDGTITSGGGSGGSSGGGGTVSSYKYGIIKNGNPIGGKDNGEHYGKQEYVMYNVSFTAGERFALYDFNNNATWAVDLNSYSFGAEGNMDIVNSYVSKSVDEYTAQKSFTADIYIQLQYQNDTVYIELK